MRRLSDGVRRPHMGARSVGSQTSQLNRMETATFSSPGESFYFSVKGMKSTINVIASYIFLYFAL